MRTLDHRTDPRNHVARRARVVALIAPLLIVAGCAGSDDTAPVASSSQPDTATSPSAEPTSTETTPSTEPTSTTTTTTTTTSTPPTTDATTTTPESTSTAPAPSSTTSPPTTGSDRPEQSIPPALRGTWRVSDGDTVTLEECDTSANFGQLLTVRSDGYTYFEAGGVLIEVIERDESRVEASFETTAGGPNTSIERVTLDAQDGGNVLIVDDAQPGVVRLVRCPSTEGSDTTGTDAEPLELESFDLARVRKAGIESIGCTVRPGEDNDLEPVFFANGDGGFMVIDGEAITLANSTTADLGVIPDLESGLTFSQDGYAATFVTVGPAEPNSIESTEQEVTLAVATPDGRRTRLDGIAFCGV